jgi:ABC-type xylose transport system permease subunit
MRRMKRLLLVLCGLFVVATLLLWAWLFWLHADPDVLLLPAAVVYLGLSFHRIRRLHTVLERWYAFEMTKRTGCFLFLLVLLFHLASSIPFLIASLIDAPAHLSFLAQLVLGMVRGAYWFVAISVVLLALLQVLLNLPRVGQRLTAWMMNDGANR